MPTVAVNNDESFTGSDDDIKARIVRLIANPPRNSRVFRITPGVATWILDKYNNGNRPPKPHHIARYADDMEAEEWEITGDNLKFSDAGKLRDGQNRLRACVRSDAPFTTHIVFGIADASFDRMDRGRNRDGLDILAIAGFQNSGVLAGAVKHVHNLLSSNPASRDGVEPREALRLVREEYPTLPDFIPAAREIRQVTGQPMSAVTALLYVFAQKNPAKAEEFAKAWGSGKHVGRYAALAVLQKAVTQRASVTHGRLHETERFAFIITAWNLCVAGNKGRVSQFVWKPGDPLPEIAG